MGKVVERNYASPRNEWQLKKRTKLQLLVQAGALAEGGGGGFLPAEPIFEEDGTTAMTEEDGTTAITDE